MIAAAAADKFRIAVALVAVSMKPPGRSFPSYVIDLRDRFPQTLTCGPRGSEPWRERALALEDELGEAKLEVQKLTLELRAKEKPTSSTLSSSQTKPKKKRSHQSESTPRASDTAGGWAKWEASLPTIFESIAIISSQKKLKTVLARGDDGTDGWPSLLLATCHQVLAGYGNLFAHCLSPKHRLQGSKVEFRSLLDNARDLYCQFLQVLSTPSVSSFVDKSLVSHAFSLVIRPHLREMSAQSRIIIQELCEPRRDSQRKKKEGTETESNIRDPRPWMWEILEMTLVWLEKAKISSSGGIHDTLLVETLQLLDQLLEDFAIPVSATHTLSRSDRITRLAAKQSLWYLCSLIQLCLSPSAIQQEDEKLKPAISAIFSKIASRLSGDNSSSRFSLCGVEREMLIALMEQFWISGKLSV